MKKWLKHMVTPKVTPLGMLGWYSWGLMLGAGVSEWVKFFVCLPIVTLAVSVSLMRDAKASPSRE